MQIGMINRTEGSEVRIHGKSQGYLGLPCRHEGVIDQASGCEVHAITTAWLPTPDELEALNKGAAVHVQTLYLTNPVPMMVTVGEVPE